MELPSSKGTHNRQTQFWGIVTKFPRPFSIAMQEFEPRVILEMIDCWVLYYRIKTDLFILFLKGWFSDCFDLFIAMHMGRQGDDPHAKNGEASGTSTVASEDSPLVDDFPNLTLIPPFISGIFWLPQKDTTKWHETPSEEV